MFWIRKLNKCLILLLIIGCAQAGIPLSPVEQTQFDQAKNTVNQNCHQWLKSKTMPPDCAVVSSKNYCGKIIRYATDKNAARSLLVFKDCETSLDPVAETISCGLCTTTTSNCLTTLLRLR